MVFQDVSDEIVVFVERRQVVMSTSVYSNKSNVVRSYFLQGHTLRKGNQPVFGAVQNIGMAFYILHPDIGS
jgi:hypothetical protein